MCESIFFSNTNQHPSTAKGAIDSGSNPGGPTRLYKLRILPLTQNVGVNVGVKLTKTNSKFLELLKNNGWMTASDLAEQIGSDKSGV